MLLRHQVLLTDWQTDHLKKMAKRSDVSFSELIRIILCEGLLRAGMVIHPEYEKKINKKKLNRLTTEGADIKTDIGRRHSIVSELYFEARKMVDYFEERVAHEEKRAEP